MEMSKPFLRICQLLLGLFGLISTLYVAVEFIYFISVPKVQPYRKDSDVVTWSLLVNVALLSVFYLQHSLMATSKMKDIFQAYGFEMVFRSVYSIATSGILLCLIRNWKTTNVILWSLNLNYKPLWWLFVSAHIVAWVVIYVSNMCRDVTELLGLKQVFYSLRNLPDPNLKKSVEYQNLNNHMRHPSFSAFALLFWFTPLMSLDRMLLAVILTGYMYVTWNTTRNDYYYVKYQLERKRFSLDHSDIFKN
ncbi:unnamed protein product [Phyllotreta striolata]|uniref:Nuclear envelope membrane protein n=1 Tax=Phyllotreta striolata TaxID=444603 RepID=A0A9N9TLV8_PHYSR|nr:unnamed protein product [Phyllotreta striolata]